jgi:hypothetical protein
VTSKDVFFGKKTQKTNGKYGFKLIGTRKNGDFGHNFDNRWCGLRGKMQELNGTAWIFHQIHRGFLYIFHQCPFNIFDEVRVKKKGKPIKIQGQNVVETQHCQGYLNGHKRWKHVETTLAQVVFLLSGNQAHGKASFSANILAPLS